jgi:hypothetical protein
MILSNKNKGINAKCDSFAIMHAEIIATTATTLIIDVIWRNFALLPRSLSTGQVEKTTNGPWR